MPFFILNAVLFGTTMVMTYDTIAKSKQKFDKRNQRNQKKKKKKKKKLKRGL